MSIKIMSKVWEMDLPPFEKLVLLALSDNASDEGSCFPSIATIIRKTCVSEATVHRCIADLVKKGLLQQHFRQGRSTIYTVLNCTPPLRDTPIKQIPTPPHTETPPPLTVRPIIIK